MDTFNFEKRQIGNNWILVCTSYTYFPTIESCQDGTFKIKHYDGKVDIEHDFNAAMKLAMNKFTGREFV